MDTVLEGNVCSGGKTRRKKVAEQTSREKLTAIMVIIT